MVRYRGFTLIEAMVVLVILGIIALIAIPSYNTYIQQTRRYEAISALESIYLLQEKYYLKHNKYTGLNDIWSKNNTDNYYYDLSLTNISDQGFIIKAFAIDNQKNDRQGKTNCATLSLEVNKQKIIRKPKACWKY